MDCGPSGDRLRGFLSSRSGNRQWTGSVDNSRKACLQIFRHTRVLSDAVKKIGGAIKTPRCPCNRHWPSFDFFSGNAFFFFLVGMTSCVWDPVARCICAFARTGRLSLSHKNRFVCVGDACLFVGLIDDSRHMRPLLSLQYIHCNDEQCKKKSHLTFLLKAYSISRYTFSELR
jgi:hypothetical protein